MADAMNEDQQSQDVVPRAPPIILSENEASIMILNINSSWNVGMGGVLNPTIIKVEYEQMHRAVKLTSRGKFCRAAVKWHGDALCKSRIAKMNAEAALIDAMNKYRQAWVKEAVHNKWYNIAEARVDLTEEHMLEDIAEKEEEARAKEQKGDKKGDKKRKRAEAERKLCE